MQRERFSHERPKIEQSVCQELRGKRMTAFRIARKRIARGLYALVRSAAPAAYAQDGLITVHSHAFMQDPAFKRAYARGVKAIGGADTYAVSYTHLSGAAS